MAIPEKKKTDDAIKAPKKASVAAPVAQALDADTRNSLQRRKLIVGTVVSDKMQKTIVVKIDRRVRHTSYGKYIVKTHRFKAHDEKNEAKIGDQVQLVESRPLSRDKRWVLCKILRKASQVAEVNV